MSESEDKKVPWMWFFVVFIFLYILSYVGLRGFELLNRYPQSIFENYMNNIPPRILTEEDRENFWEKQPYVERGLLSRYYLPLILIEEFYWYNQWEKGMSSRTIKSSS